jgi:hypothetical protein
MPIWQLFDHHHRNKSCMPGYMKDQVVPLTGGGPDAV